MVEALSFSERRDPGVICNQPLDPKQHHSYCSRYGEGVDLRHAALACCYADVFQSHSGFKVFTEQEVLAFTRAVTDRLITSGSILSSTLNGLSHVFGCLYCFSFLLQSVPGLCC